MIVECTFFLFVTSARRALYATMSSFWENFQTRRHAAPVVVCLPFVRVRPKIRAVFPSMDVHRLTLNRNATLLTHACLSMLTYINGKWLKYLLVRTSVYGLCLLRFVGASRHTDWLR